MSHGHGNGRQPPNPSTIPPEPPRRIIPRSNGSGTNSSTTNQQPQRTFKQPAIREIHKNAWLKRQCLDKKSGPFVKKYDRFWVVFCVHDDVEGLLEFYKEPKMGQLHKPLEVISLNSCCHVSPSIIGEDNEYEFAVTLPSQVIRLVAANWDQMMEWVEALQFKLREMKVASPKDNLYSKLPETKSSIVQSISTFRDPNSPLPPPPEVTHDYIPLISRPTPSSHNYELEFNVERLPTHQNEFNEITAEFNRNCTVVNSSLYIHPFVATEESSNENSNGSGLSFQSSDLSSSGMEMGSSESLIPRSSRNSGELPISFQDPLEINTITSKPETPQSSFELCTNGNNAGILPKFPSQTYSNGTITYASVVPKIKKKTIPSYDNFTPKSFTSVNNKNDSSRSISNDFTNVTNRSELIKTTPDNLYEPIFTTSMPPHNSVANNKCDDTRPPEIPIKKRHQRDAHAAVINEMIQRSSSTNVSNYDEPIDSLAKGIKISIPRHRRTQSGTSAMPGPSNLFTSSSENTRNSIDIPIFRDGEHRICNNTLPQSAETASSIENNSLHEEMPATVNGNVTHVPLKEQQVLKLRAEMGRTSGIRTVLRKKDCVGSIAFVDYLGAVWIGGWNQIKHPVLYYAFHVGDQILKVCSTSVQNSSEAIQAIKMSSSSQVEFIIRRLPYGKVFLLKREKEGDLLGLSSVGKGYGSEMYVLPDGSAARQGVPSSAVACDGVTSCHWSLTEINGRPLSLICKEAEVKERLNAVGKEITILVQPSDLVKHLRKQLKSMKNFKDYILG